MNRVAVAQELVKLARELVAESNVPDFKNWRRNQKFLQYWHKESGEGARMGISQVKKIWDKWIAETFNK